MPSNLKGDFVNGAFSQLRISGITVVPSPEDLELALERLEDMASESPFSSTGYYFEDEPDPNTPHNIPRKYWQGFKAILALRLMPDFGKGAAPDPMLIKQANAGLSTISAGTARIQQIQYPARMPKGSGTTLRSGRWTRFFTPEVLAPIVPETVRMYVDDIRSFTESFASYLLDGETISSYTIDSDTGLTITADANADPDITYTIRADGSSPTGGDAFLQVKIVVTTSGGRKETRIINFELLASDID
jgi:hypothetical protein